MTDFLDLVDVAAERLGGAVVACNDEFFAPRERLLLPNEAEWREGVYTERGKWMDGWETRRRRTPGHDWCIVRLGLPAIVRGVVVDTAWFRGNYPESCSLEGCAVDGTPDAGRLTEGTQVGWTEVLARSPLEGHRKNVFPTNHPARLTHLRFNIFPDGGVARLRVHGEVVADDRMLRAGREVDLAALENGAFVVVCSDMFFGHRQNLILPGRSTHMGDGWETKRRRGPGHDWTVVRLGARGVIERIELDTDHYKGNAPAACALETVDAPGAGTDHLTSDALAWSSLLDRTPLEPHARHRFGAANARPATHARLSIFPDGGVARLRLFGQLTA